LNEMKYYLQLAVQRFLKIFRPAGALT